MLEDTSVDLNITNCCVCQYMPIDACQNVRPENWKPAAAICTNCSFNGATPTDWKNACNIVKVDGKTDCTYDEDTGTCMGRFKKTCLDKKKAESSTDVINTEFDWKISTHCGDNFVLVKDPTPSSTSEEDSADALSKPSQDFKQLFEDKGLSCDSIWWFRDGHDLDFCRTADAIEACLECTSGQCNGVNLGCRVLIDWDSVHKWIEEIRSQLQAGQTIRLHASQSTTSSMCRNSTTITITGNTIDIVFPECKDLGYTHISNNDCYTEYEMAKCTDENGTLVWHQCCPAHANTSSGCKEYNQWQSTGWNGTPPKPICHGTGVFRGTCEARIDKSDLTNIESRVADQIRDCYKSAQGTCEKYKSSGFSHKYLPIKDEGDSYLYVLEWECRYRAAVNTCNGSLLKDDVNCQNCTENSSTSSSSTSSSSSSSSWGGY